MNAARPPALFLGHGNPLHALGDNRWTRAWRALGARLPRPRAVLCVSAHWYVAGAAVTAAERPRTLHDFAGFPPELFAVQYPAPGDPALARRAVELLAPEPVALDLSWGFDHGAWAVLRHLFPDADVPVLELALDARRPPHFHYELGRRLAPLRDDGVLVLGSGNVVHNLRQMSWTPDAPPHDWATRFEARVREFVLAGDHDALIEYQHLGDDAALAVPTPEHYLPLLYVLGAGGTGVPVQCPIEGIDGGSISMLAVQAG